MLARRSLLIGAPVSALGRFTRLTTGTGRAARTAMSAKVLDSHLHVWAPSDQVRVCTTQPRRLGETQSLPGLNAAVVA
jgi:hypothetical protein